MTQSIRYQISSLFVDGLRAWPALAGATLKHNPRGPSPLRDGGRVVWFEDQTDALIDSSNQQDRRRFVFAVGIINRDASPEPEAGADADYVAAVAAIRATYADAAALLNRLKGLIKPLREVQVTFKVDDLDVDGALILAIWELEYLLPREVR